jgi:hypothetical protein
MIVVGALLVSLAAIWYLRTARERGLWTRAGHDTGKLAIVLELEDRVRDVDVQRGRAGVTR